MNNKRFLKGFGLLLVVALLVAALPTGRAQAATLCVNPDGTGGCKQTIQAAVTEAGDGDTINVAAGTYVEDITIPAGKQLNIIGEVDADGNPLPVITGTLSASGLTDKTWRIENLNFVDDGNGDSIYLNSGGNLTVRNCTFDGAGLFMNGHRAIQASGSNHLTVENSTFQNGWYVSLQGVYASLNVNNSTFTNVKSGINVQGPAGNTVTIDNTDFSVIAQGPTNDTYGVRFASEGSGTGGNLTITDSSFVLDKNDLVAEEGTYHSAIIVRAGATGTLKVENSSILGEVVNLATPVLDASPNWWGSPDGPAEGQISGKVDFTPWLIFSDLVLDNSDIDENLPVGTPVGKFSPVDADPSTVFTYELEDDDENPDNNPFKIVRDQLLSNAKFDFEDETSYDILVRATDPWENPVFEKSFTIAVKDVNEPPTLTIEEVEGTPKYKYEIYELDTVTFTAKGTDVDAGQDLIYELVGAPDGAEINEESGVFIWEPTEAQGPKEYIFTVKVCDDGTPSLCAQKDVTITVKEANLAPVAKNATYGVHFGQPLVVDAAHGVLSHVTDADLPTNELRAKLGNGVPVGEGTLTLNANGSFTYTPPAGVTVDFDTSFTFKANDGTVDSDAATVTLKIRSVNQNPTDITLSEVSVAENAEYTGELATEDPDDLDEEDPYVYEIVQGVGDYAKFRIEEGDQLVSDGFNYEERSPADYRVLIRTTDIFGGSYERWFTIHVTNLNEAPVLGEIGSLQVNEGSKLTFNATASDPDLPAQTLEFSLADGAEGEVPEGAVITAAGAFSWTPTEAQGPGEYTFDVCVSDGELEDCETITVTVNEVNVAPVLAEIGDKSVAELALLSFTATATDVDEPAQTRIFSLVGAPTGAAIIPTTGLFIWTPTEAQGPDEYNFDVCVSDGALTDCETITVTVEEENENPIAVADNYVVVIGQPLEVGVDDGVLKNDSDADIPANILTVERVGGPGLGQLELNSDGSFTYTPPETSGEDLFTYKVSDGKGGTAQATITFTIREEEENHAPTDITLDPSFGEENKVYEGKLTTNDEDEGLDSHKYELVSGAGDSDNDKFKIEGDKLVSNEPFNYETQDSYDVRIQTTDLFGASFVKRFIITVDDANDAPVAKDDTFTTKPGEAVDITLPATDEDDDELTFAIYTEPQNGEVESQSVGTTITTESGILSLIDKEVTYTPNPGFVGEDSFTFKAADEEGALSNLATITIIVNDVPVAVENKYETDEDTELVVEAEDGLLVNDINEYEMEPLKAVLVTDVSHGELALEEDGTFTYMPEANFAGDDSFTYQACEGEICSKPAKVTITVKPVNDAPIANDDEYDAWMGRVLEVPAEIGVLANDTDPDPGDVRSVVVKDEPLHGELELKPDGSFTYEPAAGFYGVDTFTYWLISEPGVQQYEYLDSATVTITVRPFARLFLPIIVK